MKRLVVVGNGMAGMACVEQILKYAPMFRITVFGDETHANYNRIMLSSVLAGEKSASLREQNDAYGHSLYYADADYDVAERVVEVAKQKGVLPIQVALAWVLSKPGIAAPIISATKIEQMDQLIDGMKVTLTVDDVRALEEPYRPHPVLGIE